MRTFWFVLCLVWPKPYLVIRLGLGQANLTTRLGLGNKTSWLGLGRRTFWFVLKSLHYFCNSSYKSTYIM